MLVTLFVISSLALSSTPTTPGELLLDLHKQEAFVREHESGFLRVHYKPLLMRHLDPGFQPHHSVLGAYVQMDDGAKVLVPTHRVSGIDRAEIELADGRRIPARFEEREADNLSPFRVLVPEKERALESINPLKWSDEGMPSEGLVLWAIEWPKGQQLPNSKARPILVRALMEGPVEPPLERFFYVGIGRADGLALLTHRGHVQCLVFRAVPGTVGRSICSPKQAVRQSQASSEKKKNVP